MSKRTKVDAILNEDIKPKKRKLIVDMKNWFHAALYGQNEVIETLLANKADVDYTNDNNSWTALISAAQEGHNDVIGTLLANKADVNHATNNGQTALMTAALHGQNEVIETLLANKADVDRATHDIGQTALIYAAQEGHNDAIVTLLTNKADVDQATHSGQTALIYAAQDRHNDVIGTLLANKADVNHATHNGWTALIAAAQEGYNDVIGTLLAKGAAVDQGDQDGQTALMTAALHGHNEVIGTLLANKADVDRATHDGRTALMAAAHKGHNEVIGTLLAKGAEASTKAILTAQKAGHVESMNAILMARSIDEAFSGAQYNQIADDMPVDLFMARYKSLLLKSGFKYITEKHIKNRFAEVTNIAIKESLINLFAEGEQQIDLCCANIFYTLYADVNCTSPIFLLLSQQGRFNTNNPETLKEIKTLELFYQQMGYNFNFQQVLNSPEVAEEKKDDSGSLSLLENVPHAPDLNELKAEIHKANLNILTKNIYTYVEQAHHLRSPEGDEIINLLKDLKSQYALPNTLTESLEKALNHENYLNNHVTLEEFALDFLRYTDKLDDYLAFEVIKKILQSDSSDIEIAKTLLAIESPEINQVMMPWYIIHLLGDIFVEEIE